MAESTKVQDQWGSLGLPDNLDVSLLLMESQQEAGCASMSSPTPLCLCQAFPLSGAQEEELRVLQAPTL